MTPFSSIKNITANIDSIETKSWSWSTSNGNGYLGGGGLKVFPEFEKSGLFAGNCSGGSSAWYQGGYQSCYGVYLATYYPPEGSSQEPYVFIDSEGQAIAGSISCNNVLVSFEEGGHLEFYTTCGNGNGNSSITLSGTMIYLSEE